MNSFFPILIVSIALFYLTFNIDIDLLLESLFMYSFDAIIYVVIITIVSFFILSYRWQILSLSNISFYNSYKVNLLAMAINQILPIRAGDLYKPTYLRKNYSIETHKSISSIVLERSLDLSIISFISLIVLFGSIFLEKTYFLFSMIIFLFIGIFIFIKYIKDIIKVLKKIKNKRIKKALLQIIINIYKTSYEVLIMGIISTILLYMFYVLSLYGFIYFFTNFDLSFFEVMIVFIISALGMSLPTTPAGIGVYEASIVFILGYFGINNEEALSFAIVYHLLQIITILFLWLFFYSGGNLCLKKEV
ncbi:MAG: flippase-like domain-containing protein [Campylobacteraceae bacterium]|nr:flippase-like domain-containing protein [Campylobacteraceae bacterium]